MPGVRRVRAARGSAIAVPPAAGLLVLAVHFPASPAAAADPTAAVVAGCCWLAWVLAAYLLAGTALTAIAAGWTRPGAVEPLPAVARRALPAPIRAMVLTAVSVTVAAAAALPATASGSHASPAAGLDWPGLPSVGHATTAVTVRPGDTLWAIAARSLRSPSVSRIALTWPRWYAANRRTIGPDPGLIRPGERLRPPDRTGAAR
jgi:hypothetical protein